jgi:hypothetical protein
LKWGTVRITTNPPRDDSLVVEATNRVKFVADGHVTNLEGETFDLIIYKELTGDLWEHVCFGCFANQFYYY